MAAPAPPKFLTIDDAVNSGLFVVKSVYPELVMHYAHSGEKVNLREIWIASVAKSVAGPVPKGPANILFTKRAISGRKIAEPPVPKSTICWLCGYETTKERGPLMITRDHFVPKSKGGRGIGNYRTAHSMCNQMRGNKDVDEVLRERCRERVSRMLERDAPEPAS